MIVSMPQIPLNATSMRSPVGAKPPAGKFSAVLANAAGSDQDAGSTINSGSTVTGSSGKAAKGSGKSIKKSSDSPSTGTSELQTAAPMPPKEQIIKNLPSTSFFLPAIPEPQANETSDTVSDSDSSDSTQTAPSQVGGSCMAGPGPIALSITPEVVASTVAPSCDLAHAKAEDAEEPVPIDQVKADPRREVTPMIAKAADPAQDDKTKPSAERTVVSPVVPAAPVTVAKPVVDAKQSVPAPVTHDASPVPAKGTATAAHATSNTEAAAHKTAEPVSSPLQILPMQVVKPDVLPQAMPSAGVGGKSDSGIVPPSSTSLKKDGDAAKNPPPSDKTSSVKESVSFSVKQVAGSDGPLASPSPSSGNATTQISPLVEAKPTSVNVPAKDVDMASKNPAQAAAAANPEAQAELATALHTSSPIQVARLIERAGQTELRVGIQAGEFGNVDIRTSMARSQFSAEISVERGELGRVLSAELPALHNRLAEQRVPVSNIVLQDHSASNNSSDLRQGSRNNPYPQTNLFRNDEAEPSVAPVFSVDSVESNTGLDLHM